MNRTQYPKNELNADSFEDSLKRKNKEELKRLESEINIL